MKRDLMHFFAADVKTVYQAYLAAAQNEPFSRACEQAPYYSFQFGLSGAAKYNMNGGACTLHFIPYQGGTAVNLRFSIAQLVGARYAAYDRDLANRVVDLLRLPAQPLEIDVEIFLQERNWVMEDAGVKKMTLPAPQPSVPEPPVPEPPTPEPPVPEAPVSVQCCDRCGYALLPNAKFCSVCGAPVRTEALCVRCGKPLLPNAQFCSYCGQKQ